MEAARVAAKRGHIVVLAEATADLGGTLRYAAMAPTRHQFTDFVQWAQNEVYAEGVDVRLSTYVTEEDLKDLAPDHVILATGAEPRVDGIQLSHPGEPMVGVSVRLIARIAVQGQPRLASGPMATTDDRGAYRFSGLAPGRYLVAVPSTQATVPASASFGNRDTPVPAIDSTPSTRLVLGRAPLP